MDKIDLDTPSRRHLLAMGGIGTLSLAVHPNALLAKSNAPPPDAGRKFSAEGQVLPFVGNTVICHLDQQGVRSLPFNILLDCYRQAPSRSYADKIALLPPSSYHMTIFGGATDTGRQPGQWPTGVPIDAPIEECNHIVGDRIKNAAIGPVDPIRMRVDTAVSGYDGNTLRIPLTPADEAETRKLRDMRDQLSQVIGVRSLKHESYQFHVTLGYLVRSFTAKELRDAEQDMARWKQDLAERAPIIELGQPEYCTFEDMFAFHRRFFI